MFFTSPTNGWTRWAKCFSRPRMSISEAAAAALPSYPSHRRPWRSLKTPPPPISWPPCPLPHLRGESPPPTPPPAARREWAISPARQECSRLLLGKLRSKSVFPSSKIPCRKRTNSSPSAYRTSTALSQVKPPPPSPSRTTTRQHLPSIAVIPLTSTKTGAAAGARISP